MQVRRTSHARASHTLRARWLIIAVPCIVWGIQASHIALASEVDDAAMLGQLMGSRAIGLVRLDLAKVTPEQLTLPLAIGNTIFKDSGVESREQLVAVARALNQAGPRYAYLVIEVPQKIGIWPVGFCVVPTNDAQQAEQVERAFQTLSKSMQRSEVDVKRFPSAVVAGAAEQLPSISNSSNEEGRDLGAILASAGDSPLFIALTPTNDQRRVLQELLPAIPPAELRQSVAALAANVRWMTAAFDNPPQLALRMVARYGDEPQAAAAAPAFTAITLALSKLFRAEQGIDGFKPEARGNEVVVEFDNEALQKSSAFLEPHIKSVASAAARSTAANRMKHVGMAMHNYAASHQEKTQGSRFPDASSRDPQGRPLLSWRVLILPYLKNGQELYREFHLDEPWDSPHNKLLISRMPTEYRIGSPANLSAGKTCLVLPIGDGTIFPEGRSVDQKQISDGLSNTMLGLEANDERAVTWTRPDDLPVDLAAPAAGLGGHFGPGVLALMADGSVQYFDTKDETKIRALMTRDGKEVIKY